MDELPLVRKLEPRDGRLWLHLEIGGDCLRIGKTTTKQVLAEQIGNRGLPFVFSDEEWKDNKYLKDAYLGLGQGLLWSQKWFAQKKRTQLQTISANCFWIQVTHPEMDYGYALTNFLIGKLSKADWEEYKAYYRSLNWEKVPAPDLLIYLTADTKALIERFKDNARDFEKADETYIRVMQKVNQEWLQRARAKYPVLVIETTYFDYSYQTGTAAARDDLGKRIFSKLAEEGWKF